MTTSKQSYRHCATNTTTNTYLLLLVLGCATAHLAAGAQINVDVQHDLSQPTFGLQGPTSSKMSYNDQQGLNLKGTISDLLGPPIKIANGFGHMVEGSKLAGLGTGLLTGGAVLGIDAKALEAVGGAKLLKGGLLLGGAAAKTAAATMKGGIAGKKIASVIELPVKVVAMKDIAEGKALATSGALRGAKAVAAKAKGAALISRGDQLKIQGLGQVREGAQEGIQNIGNMMQQASGNAASALKFLPIILDLPSGQPQQQVEQQIEQSTVPQQQYESKTRQSSDGAMTGGSLFGGLGSLMNGGGGAGGPDPLMNAISQGISTMTNIGHLGNPNNNGEGGLGRLPFNMLGGLGQNHESGGYAVGLNRDNPFLSMLSNPQLNPLLLPLRGGQAAQGKGGIGGNGGFPFGQQTNSFNYDFIPGLKVHESTSSQLPQKGNIFGGHHNSGNQQKGQQVEQQQVVQQQFEQQPQVKQLQQQEQQKQVEKVAPPPQAPQKQIEQPKK